MKVIPSIDLIDKKVVRLSQGDPSRMKVYSNDAPSIAAKWEELGADALHLVDLDATLSKGNNLEVLHEISDKVGIPLQVGGGIRSIEYAQNLLGIGIKRLVIGTIALEKKKLFEDMLSKVGKERIIVALDYRGDEIVTRGWTKPAGIKLLDALKEVSALGVNTFLLTCVERDGMLSGPDLAVLKRAKQSSGAEIQASGGVSSIDDIRKLMQAGVDAAIIGKALYEKRIKLEDTIALTRGVMKAK